MSGVNNRRTHHGYGTLLCVLLPQPCLFYVLLSFDILLHLYLLSPDTSHADRDQEVFC